jgi:hypothetical protein
MSREEAAMAYLNSLLGFREDYGTYRQAADVLAGTDRTKMETAASVRLPAGRVSKE